MGDGEENILIMETLLPMYTRKEGNRSFAVASQCMPGGVGLVAGRKD